MDFSLFSKPLSVRGLGGRKAIAGAKGTSRSARTLALIKGLAANGEAMHQFTATRHGNASDRARAAAAAVQLPAFEVGDADVGLCPALENAALLHASGQSAVALQLLGGALSNDADTRGLARAWHAQFDLLQRAHNRDAFEQLALEYVTAFEASPPPWDECRKAVVAKAPRVASGYFAIGQVSVKSALEVPARAARYASLKIDVATVRQFDDMGCRRMVDVLRRLRRRGYPIAWQGVSALMLQIRQHALSGTAENEGIWLFGLEVQQWCDDRVAFEDRAIEYAITFEVSPPSWEPLAPAQLVADAAQPAAARASTTGPAPVADALVGDACRLAGVLTGPSDPQIAALVAFAAGGRKWVAIDMTQVERMDFVCAGALQNALSGFETNHKRVQIIGASAIVEALLLLIGVNPKAFAPPAG